MNFLSLSLLAACVAAAAASAAPDAVEDATRDFKAARSGLEALDNFTKMLNPDRFAAEPAPVLLGLISKGVSIISSVIGMFQRTKSGSSADPEVNKQLQEMAQSIRVQFQQVNLRLDQVSLQLDEVKHLIEWRTTRGMYSDFEVFITASSHMLDKLVTSPENQWDVRRRQFITTFKAKRLAGLKLYQAIVETDSIISENLAVAAVHYTQNHRRKVASFLLAMIRLIFRGAQLETAYEMLEHGESAASITEADWRERMEKLVVKVKQVDAQVAAAWHGQMLRDTQHIVTARQGLPHGEMAQQLWRFLVEKFPWRHWFTLVHGTMSHAHWLCGGTQYSHVPANRVVVIASSDRVTTRFDKPRADVVLAAITRVGDHSFQNLVNEMHARLGHDCNVAAFKGAVHSDGTPHWAESGGRVSHAAIGKVLEQIKIIRNGFGTRRVIQRVPYSHHMLLFG